MELSINHAEAFAGEPIPLIADGTLRDVAVDAAGRGTDAMHPAVANGSYDVDRVRADFPALAIKVYGKSSDTADRFFPKADNPFTTEGLASTAENQRDSPGSPSQGKRSLTARAIVKAAISAREKLCPAINPPLETYLSAISSAASDRPSNKAAPSIWPLGRM